MDSPANRRLTVRRAVPLSGHRRSPGSPPAARGTGWWPCPGRGSAALSRHSTASGPPRAAPELPRGGQPPPPPVRAWRTCRPAGGLSPESSRRPPDRSAASRFRASWSFAVRISITHRGLHPKCRNRVRSRSRALEGVGRTRCTGLRRATEPLLAINFFIMWPMGLLACVMVTTLMFSDPSPPGDVREPLAGSWRSTVPGLSPEASAADLAEVDRPRR